MDMITKVIRREFWLPGTTRVDRWTPGGQKFVVDKIAEYARVSVKGDDTPIVRIYSVRLYGRVMGTDGVLTDRRVYVDETEPAADVEGMLMGPACLFGGPGL